MKDLKKFEEVKKTCDKVKTDFYGEDDYVYTWDDCLKLIDLKFDDKKRYVCVEDFQGGNWAMGCCLTAKGWAERALEWCDSDGCLDTISNMIDNDDEHELIGDIIDIWQIWIQPIRPLIEIDENYIIDALNERYYENWFYVLRYDTKTTEYNNEIEFLEIDEAFTRFNEMKPSYPNERIELIFAPDNDKEFTENVIITYKEFGD